MSQPCSSKLFPGMGLPLKTSLAFVSVFSLVSDFEKKRKRGDDDDDGDELDALEGASCSVTFQLACADKSLPASLASEDDSIFNSERRAQLDKEVPLAKRKKPKRSISVHNLADRQKEKQFLELHSLCAASQEPASQPLRDSRTLRKSTDSKHCVLKKKKRRKKENPISLISFNLHGFARAKVTVAARLEKQCSWRYATQ